MKLTWHYLALTLTAALLFRAGLPPLNWGWTILFAWTPLLVIAQRYSLMHVLLSAALAGAAWVSDLPLALLGWGWQLPLFSLLLSMTLLALLFFILRFLVIPSWFGLFTFPLAFCALVAIGQNFLPTPLALSPILIESFPEAIAAASVLGFYGMEFTIALINSIAAWIFLLATDYFYHKKFKPHVAIKSGLDVFSLATALLTVTSLATAVYFHHLNRNTAVAKAGESITLYALQPAISHQDAQRAGNSLYHRKKNESQLDKLTTQALSRAEPGLIIWPEGGHNYPNLSLKRRREIMASWLEESASEVIFSGYEYNGRGERFNTVSHLTRQGFSRSIAKNKTAPLAENYLARGEPEVLPTRFGTSGIAICYEALFTRHFARLKQKGAQLFLVLTDNSSFGKTYLYTRHVNYVRVNAAIYQTPALFLNNFGSSYLIDRYGQIVGRDNDGNSAHIIEWRTEISRNQLMEDGSSTPTGNRLFFIVLLVLLSVHIRYWLMNKKFSAPALKNIVNSFSEKITSPAVILKKIPLSALTLICLSSGILFLVMADIVVNATARKIRLSEAKEEILSRFYGEAPLDALAPLYKQQQKSSCGAAALTYALTRMGDWIFETDVLQAFPASNSEGYSLGELRRIANIRGFHSQAQRAEVDDLPGMRDMPVIALLKEKHYVTVIHQSDDEVVYFDPAYGEVFNAEKNEFAGKWTGVMLTLAYHDAWFNESMHFSYALSREELAMESKQ